MTYPDKQKPSKFVFSRSTLQEILKELQTKASDTDSNLNLHTHKKTKTKSANKGIT